MYNSSHIQTAEAALRISRAMQQELVLRQSIADNLWCLEERDVQLANLSAWLEQPYFRKEKHLLLLFDGAA